METKRILILGFLVLLLSASVILIRRDNEFSIGAFDDTFEKIDNESIDEIRLTIYYMSPYLLTDIPLSVDHLISDSTASKTVIEGSSLEEHIRLFRQISNNDLIPVKNKSYLNARLYYILESKKSGKLYDVAMWGSGNSIFFNGLEVKENDIFYDAVMHFLSEDLVKELKTYLNMGHLEQINNSSYIKT